MSSASDSGTFSGKIPAKLPEKASSFTQTCSMLSQFLKEKRSFGDLSLNLNSNFDANGTMNLFPVAKQSGQVSDASTRNLTSMDLFPQNQKLDSSVIKTEAETAQMTIFYGGRVIVFNDFPADKAKEVMHLAWKGSSHMNPPTFASTHIQKPIEPTNLIPTTSSSNVVSNIGNNLTQDRVHRPPQPVVTDLPKIARKASLTRFLEKRKDRITSRAPYYTNSSTPSPPKTVEDKSWLGLAAQSPVQFEGQL
ncbi:protein TIFY 10A-like [Actinidia eriantha]|uniref:protein TIFY 10A-like n=1 Tax=Actinidia eriantha TaxID=165200 RepID=UPI002585E559|nr:protein TIFY 10A-like [Actinidia eriantha]